MLKTSGVTLPRFKRRSTPVRTGVERRLNLGSVTPDVLSKQIGSADKILTVPKTGETDYVYHTGQYELRFVIGSDQKADHVNLKAR